MTSIPLDDIEWSSRTANALRNEGFTTTDALLRAGPQRLLHIPNFGRKSLKEVTEALHKHGISFDDKPAPPEAPDLEQMFDQLQQKLIRAFNEQARTMDERVVAVVAALNATQRANGLDQMMELLIGIRRAVDLRLDDMMLAVKLATRPGANGVSP